MLEVSAFYTLNERIYPMAELEPVNPLQSDWYSELITPLDNRELSGENQEQVLGTVRLAMGGIEQVLADGKIVNVQVSFEVVNPDGNVEFNYSAPEE
jgi:hypothetical protein